ncbi:hypothetical protein DC083_03490 [Ignatzschineria ureiclastica]|uniref:Uncharacterized protein n=1 Tax=Ignatzschineria ureiclastica TaxID=472582 RepID=A0A2U2AFV8_9GAMM|nr:hypothetical protein [Ignatzschineria ureiclastica]PWD81520.1 hypothetical protein DC083_03490 [Ignatzschineria ureiclastica]GHA01309.1 hypothetical protein GCM10007162_17060 [Ignatzschineria ureiclastica]
MKKVLFAIALSLPFVSFGYLQESSSLQTNTLTEKEYLKGAKLDGGGYIAEWYCEITLNNPFLKEGESDDRLAVGVGVDFANMIIKLNGKPVLLEEQNWTGQNPYIWLNAKENIYVTFNRQRMKEDEVGMPIIYGEMMLLTPTTQEFYPAVYYCRD